MSSANNGFGSAVTPTRPASRASVAVKTKPANSIRDTAPSSIASSDTAVTNPIPPSHLSKSTPKTLPTSSLSRWKIATSPPCEPSFTLDAAGSNSRPPWWKVFEHRYAPSLVSLVIHCVVVILLGLITFAATDSRGTFLSGVFSEESPTLVNGELLTQLANPEPPSMESPDINMSGGSSGLAEAISSINVPSSADGAGAAITDDEDLISKILGDGGGGGLHELAELSGSKSASFFGLSAKGKRFVFVIDSSTSMWGPRWIDVRKELIRSVRKLEKDQYFFVICFDTTSTSMFGEEGQQNDFANAEEGNFRKLEYWLSQHTLGPGTKASLSLVEALRLKPDAIFLLTDGEFQDNVLQTLRTGNRNKNKKRKITVNTIGFHSEVGAPVLSQIASENYGQFRYVPPPANFMMLPSRPPGRGRVYPPQTIQEIMPRF